MEENGIYFKRKLCQYSSITDFDHNINIVAEFLYGIEGFCHMPWKPTH